jgi:hypothetical protein
LAATPEQLPARPASQVSIVIADPSTGTQDELLKEAVSRARRARRTGIGGQTSIIMREMLDKALHRSSRKFKITIGALVDRVSTGGQVREVIIATNPSLEGEATALYVQGQLAPRDITVSRIARGLPVGGDLEYADGVTIAQAINARRAM